MINNNAKNISDIKKRSMTTSKLSFFIATITTVLNPLFPHPHIPHRLPALRSITTAFSN